MSTIAVIGDWQNAWVTAGCLASFGHQVTLVSRANHLNLPEPGLEHLIVDATASGHFRRVHPEQHTDVHVRGSEYAWIALDTPLDSAGGPNAEPVRLAAGQATLRCDKLIVSSQVPLGFCQKLEESLSRHVAYVPENMRLGHGVETFCKPDRVVVGASDPAYGLEVAELLKEVTRKNVMKPCHCGGKAMHRLEFGSWRCDHCGSTILTETQVLEPMLVNLPTAEMIKHATNAFLATSISLANELAELAEPFDVNMEMVSQALRADSRIGPKAYVRSGPGFAGGTLERDLKALQRLGSTPILDAVLGVNARRPHPWAASCRCQACWTVSRD